MKLHSRHFIALTMGILFQEVTYTSEMLVREYHIPPERHSYIHSGTSSIGPKNIAETYVTRSMVDRYGPIVSPTVSPTRLYETGTKGINPIKCEEIDFKTARDYEAAASICSMRDSVQTLDAVRVSRISKLFKPPSTKEYSTSQIKCEGQGLRSTQQMNDKDTSYQRRVYQSPEYSSKELNNQSGSKKEDTDHSDGENEDFSMIIRPREPENENHDSPRFGCRLPCCSRTAYRASSPESGTYSPIRIPARRPERYPSSSSPHPHSENERNGNFSRHQNGNKSAFTAVSPGNKRHEMSSSYSSMPSVKVRVIQECTSDNERKVNGYNDVITTSNRLPVENGVYTKQSLESGKSEKSGKKMIFNRGQFQTANIGKSEDFSFIKSALKKEPLCKNGIEEIEVPEMKSSLNDVVAPRPPSSYLNGITFTTAVNGHSFAYSIGRQEKLLNGVVVQCSTVDSTASEADSRLLDLARVANEQLGKTAFHYYII